MVATVGSRADPTATAGQADASPRRVRYVERMVLSAADLQAEGAYRLSARRRHDLAGHDWGIVLGLALTRGGAGGSIVNVQPGVAIDGFGRETVVAEPVAVDLSSAVDKAGPDGVDLWLLYAQEPGESPHGGSWDCGPGRNDRWHEAGYLRVTPATAAPDAWALVPESALDLAPQRASVDEPDRDWPVFLGRIGPDGTIDPTGRLYAALRGEMIVAPSGTARLVVGSEAADPNVRFAIAVPDSSGVFTNRLAIDGDGNTLVRGQLRVIGHDIWLTGRGDDDDRAVGGCERQPDEESITAHRTVPAVSFPVPLTPSTTASPWNAYRAAVTEPGPRKDQLSFETGAPEGNEDPARYRLAIGTGAGIDDGERSGFQPCLTVDAGCAVRIAGKLDVRGKLSHGPLRANPADPTFVEALTLAWMTGAQVARPAPDPIPEIT